MIRLFRVFVPSSIVALLVSEAALICTCYVVAAFIVLSEDPQVFLLYDNGAIRIAVVAACIIIGIYFHDLYGQLRIRSRMLFIQQMAVVVGAAFLVQALLGYLHLRDFVLPTWLMILGSSMVLILVPAWRFFYTGVVFKSAGSERVLFLGTSAAVQEIAEYFNAHPESGYVTVGYVDNIPAETELPGGKVLGGTHDLVQVVEQLKPDRIVVGMSERRQRLPVTQLLDLRFSGIPIDDTLAMYEATFGRIPTRELHPSQLVFSKDFGPNPGRLVLQSIYSWTLALLGALITLPILLLVTILVKITSPGPALFRQQRVGKNDVVFTLYKFRSMYRDAEAVSGAVWAKQDDPRVTPVGKWLRRLRLDELPQLFNVLKGEMSIVGPRPERPEFVEELAQRIPYYRQRHCVKPGITGWAQINHEYSDTVEDAMIKLEYDLYYIKNLTPALDVLIAFHTAKVMLLWRGAR